MNKYKKLAMYVFLLGIIGIVSGVTFAFFNYTRTGGANTISVGNLTFNSSNGTAINISNVFPIARANIDTETDYVGSVTINVSGSTDYDKGIEYVVRAVDVNNRLFGLDIAREIPIGIDVSYTNNGTGNTIGTENNNYFNEGVRGGNTSYYKVVAPRTIEENDQLVVGYIAPGSTGINGNIEIKAFIDEEYVGISDTYPPGDIYIINPNMTPEMESDCVSFFTSLGMGQMLYEGETLSNFCNGTGTAGGYTFEEILANADASTPTMQYLVNHNIVIFSHTNSGDLETFGDRLVIPTSIWNSVQTNGLSFKIKVEANNGIWVEEPGTIESCPGCKFIYSENLQINMTTNTRNLTPTTVNSGLSDSYLDIVRNSNRRHFLGLVLNESNQVTRAFGCVLLNNTPVCVEGINDSSNFNERITNLQAEYQSDYTYCESFTGNNEGSTPYQAFYCQYDNYFQTFSEIHDTGCSIVYEYLPGRISGCSIYSNGTIRCSSGPYS